MPATVKLNDVIDALETGSEELNYFLDKRTGEIVLVTGEEMQAAEDEDDLSDYPDWQRESISKAREVLTEAEQFIELPSQFEVHEYKIMEDFCHELEDRRVGQDLLRLIKGSGAFRRFKNAIQEMGVDEGWFKFKQAALEDIAIEWLEENQIAYTRNEELIDASEANM